MRAGSIAVSAAQMEILYLAAMCVEEAAYLADRLRVRVGMNETAGARVTLNHIYCSADQWDVLQLAVRRLAAAEPNNEAAQTLAVRLLLCHAGLTPCYDLDCQEAANRTCDNCDRACCRDHSRQFSAETSVAGDCVQCEICCDRTSSENSTRLIYKRSYTIVNVSHSEGEI